LRDQDPTTSWLFQLDHKEVQELMRKSGEEVGFARVGEIIAMVDKNNDGELVSLCNCSPQSRPNLLPFNQDKLTSTNSSPA
jgi:hypothetical protein